MPSIILFQFHLHIKHTFFLLIGGIFGEMYMGVHELTVVEKIWAIIIEVVAVVAEITGAESEDLIMQVIENDKRLAALKAYAMTA